ncbi:hypothetical protein [Georgenia yuyongxinii]
MAGAVRTHDGLDVAWNNAGILPATKPLDQMILKEWHRTSPSTSPGFSSG